MKLDWMLLKNEISTTFDTATWISLKASKNDEQGNVENIGYTSDFFSCSSIAFFSEKRLIADQLSWRELGCEHEVLPSIDNDGHYSSIEQFEMKDVGPIGIHLVFDYPQPVVGGRRWILNPDLIVALGLIKDGNNWVRPEEDFVIVAREVFDCNSNHVLIEIKREFLIDYLAARNLSLRLYYCYQRAENIATLEGSKYKKLESKIEQQNGGEFELTIRKLDDVFNGRWVLYQAEHDALDNKNTPDETGNRSEYEGIRVDSVFRRDEWIEHDNRSIRVRGNIDKSLMNP
ncbi:hypothetical protein [Acinetobacter calcoaceticus]|uniref:hypothetical protein n=1 Tax=Acinetobacter calcoaceticus TaxID=471 RepID=UPI00192A77FB|nr:hypothetical protein [Acinetobacter calcoaceticus]